MLSTNTESELVDPAGTMLTVGHGVPWLSSQLCDQQLA